MIMKSLSIPSVVPFISFPLSIISLILLSVDLSLHSYSIVHDPLSQLTLFAAVITNVSVSLLSLRALTQVLSKKRQL
jgi:hypothetical protein